MGLMEIRRQILIESDSVDENVYHYGDKTFTRVSFLSNIKEPIPPGKYKASAIVKSADTDSNISIILLLDSNEKTLGRLAFSRSIGNERVSATCTTTAVATRIYFYASDTYVHGANDKASFTKIRIERTK